MGPWLQGHKPPRVRPVGEGAPSPHRSRGRAHLKEVLLLGPFKSRVGTVGGVSQNLKAHCSWLYKLLVLYRAVMPPFFLSPALFEHKLPGEDGFSRSTWSWHSQQRPRTESVSAADRREEQADLCCFDSVVSLVPL